LLTSSLGYSDSIKSNMLSLLCPLCFAPWHTTDVS